MSVVPYRNLPCTKCLRLWEVIEPQGPLLEPERFICPDCVVPVDGQWVAGRPVPYNVVPY